MNRFTTAEVKERFADLVIEYREYFQSKDQPISHETQHIVNNLRKVLRDGVLMEELVQSLIRSTRHLDH